jgi:hypothetical protein
MHDIVWLPTGVRVPFARSNAWRQLIIYAACWVSVCAIWRGITRRRSLRIVMGIIVANGLALGTLLIYQHLTGNPRTPWPLTVLTPAGLTASFIYENHAGAYLGLTAFASAALALAFVDHGKRTLMKSTPAGVLACGSLVLAACVPLSLSRGATLSLSFVTLIFIGWYVYQRRIRFSTLRGHSAGTTVIVLIVALLAVNTLSYLDFSSIYDRFDAMAEQKSNLESIHARLLADRAAIQMLRDHWLRGVGAGCFQHLFPDYARSYPEIYLGGTLFWEHAHCDWLEIPIELGLGGDLLLATGFVWLVWRIARSGNFHHAAAMPLLIGCLQTLLNAGFDFPFQCPAILATWCILIVVAVKWVEFDQRGKAGDPPE